jgi:hypothetical protein
MPMPDAHSRTAPCTSVTLLSKILCKPPPPPSSPPTYTRVWNTHSHTHTHTHTCVPRFLGASARGWVQTIILIVNRLANVTTRSPRSLAACARGTRGSGGGGGDDDGVGCEALPPLPHEMWAAILSFLRHRDIWPTPGFDTDCSVPLETIGVRLAGKQYVPPNTHNTQHTPFRP